MPAATNVTSPSPVVATPPSVMFPLVIVVSVMSLASLLVLDVTLVAIMFRAVAVTLIAPSLAVKLVSVRADKLLKLAS